MFELNIELPKKPSALIRLAVEDIEKCEADPRFRIKMTTWLDEPVPGLCEVCAAGAILVQHATVDLETLLNDFDKALSDAWPWTPPAFMHAVDAFRCGCIIDGLRTLDIKPPRGIKDRTNVIPYNLHNGLFKADMRRLATYLEGFGL